MLQAAGEFQQYTVISAPTRQGEYFLKYVKHAGIPIACLVNSKAEQKRLEKLGLKLIVTVDTIDPETWNPPDFPVGRVYLFERSLNLCCRYIQICRSWTSEPLYVITPSSNPRMIYKSLGADYVIFSRSKDVTFLAERQLNP